jgi:hypothetical protein
MALIFDRKSFRGGVTVVSETVIEDVDVESVEDVDEEREVKNEDGTPVLDADGNPKKETVKVRKIVKTTQKANVTYKHRFRVGDKGKPYSSFKDEDQILAKYPLFFTRV